MIKKSNIILLIVCIILVTICSGCSSNKEKKSQDIEQQKKISFEDNAIKAIGEVYSSCIPEDLIYAKSYISPESTIDLSSTSEVYENSDLVIVGTVTEKIGGRMIEEFEYAVLFGKMNVEKVVKGEFSDKQIELYTRGGYCTIQEYMNALSKEKEEKLERMGFTNLPDDVKNNNYLVFNYKYGKNFIEKQRYVLMLKKINDKYVCLSNYGFLELENNVSVNNLDDINSLTN
ncbi:MAG: hypothetical protein RR144_05235 [Clostridia bacterium]